MSQFRGSDAIVLVSRLTYKAMVNKTYVVKDRSVIKSNRNTWWQDFRIENVKFSHSLVLVSVIKYYFS